MIIRAANCPSCGSALGEYPENSNIILCPYCGNYSNPEGRIILTDRSERMIEISGRMEKAVKRNDAKSWDVLAQEYVALDFEMNRDVYKGAPDDPPEKVKYINKIVKQYYLISFDPEIKKAFQHAYDVVAKMSRPNPSPQWACDTARELNEAYLKYFSSLLNHPDYPFPENRMDLARMAQDTARSAVKTMEPVWGAKSVEKALIDVFGARKLESKEFACFSCGKTLQIGSRQDREIVCPACKCISYL